MNNRFGAGAIAPIMALIVALGLAGGASGAVIDLTGSSALEGPYGNIRTFSAGSVSVNTSAFGRDKGTAIWSSAFLGSTSGGLGVTDRSEPNVSAVDNIGSRDNYVLFEFSQSVVVDSAFLGSVLGDSDVRAWVGTLANPFTNHGTLSDAYLAGLGFSEVNLANVETARTADLNAGNFSGNVLVLAADPGDTTAEDQFRIGTLTLGNGASTAFDLTGASGLDGPDGNIRTFTAGSVSLNASAFSRDKGIGTWSTAFLSSTSGGLGITDTSEDTSTTETEMVDNIGLDNYVLFEFSKKVIVDSAFLGEVAGDSDLSAWIGTRTDPFNNHETLSDAYLASLGFTEVNLTDLTTPRSADLNAGNVQGNVFVTAAFTENFNDQFKIQSLTVRELAEGTAPEPATLALLGAGLAGLSLLRRKRRTSSPARATSLHHQRNGITS